MSMEPCLIYLNLPFSCYKQDYGCMGRVTQQCCQQLKKVNNPECRCEAIRQTIKQMQNDAEDGGVQQNQQEVIEKAQKLPSTCGMEPQLCQISQQGDSSV
ncbi:hypothetical protein AQUCO_08300031v1 [Aquilegia coerulea]|uniref:Bifunctional inhibitor/plant lipid transfer protein/seed storage helical domain-containing protein n=1 Tax=Aquilegia coerulea TaxID=218851 RepID=A0A2G5C746_AQUCA|nr:hypothetical protein AQUCO_08300031v1 [Aquilegia coerulea]